MSGNTPQEEGEYDFLFDYVLEFLKSPLWTGPLNEFIDEHCVIFDKGEENQIIHSQTHTKFKELVESLLEKHLANIGVSEEQFVEACAKGANQAINKRVFGQILAVDDYLTFKMMMAKRNEELNLEAMRALKIKDQLAAAPHSTIAEQRALDVALLLSRQESVKSQTEHMTEAESEEAMLLAAIEASKLDDDVKRQEIENERAELEHAIAMSLALEKEQITNEIEEEHEKELKQQETKPDVKQPPEPEREPMKAFDLPSLPPKKPKSLPPLGAQRPKTLPPLPSHLQQSLNTRLTSHQRKVQQVENTLNKKKQNNQKGKLSEEEKRRRAAFLQKQRDAILRKKQQERQAELEVYTAQPKPAPRTPSKQPAPSPSKASNDELERQRKQMRLIFARRLKQEELEREAQEALKDAEEKNEILERHLRRIEELDRQRDEMEEDEMRRMQQARKQQSRMKRNMHKNMSQQTIDAESTDFGI